MREYTATSSNTAYTTHFVRSNFGYAETSYMMETLYEIPTLAFKTLLKEVNLLRYA
jgi:hypothetical protein